MTEITVLLAAAAAGFGVALWLRLPSIPLLVVAGFAASRIVPLPEDLLADALVLGLTFMVFVAGIELNPGRVRFQRGAALRVGLAQFFVLGLLGLGVALALGLDAHAALYVALALTASSTLIVIRLLQLRRQLFEPFGRMVTGVLLLQDLLVILLIPVVTRLPDGAAAIGSGILAVVGLVGLAWIFQRRIAPFAVRRLAFDEESLLLVVLGTLFLFLGLATLFGLPLVVGAFLAGLGLSGFPVNALVRGQLSSLSDFFSAVFFTALGAFVVLPTLHELIQAAILVGVVVVVTPPLVTFLAERAGFSARPAIASGLLLAQTSEFSLVVGLQGVVLEQLAPGVFTVITLVTVVTMVLTPFLATDRVTWRLVHLHPFRRAESFGDTPEDHVLLLGCGRNGMLLLETLVVTPYRTVVVDDDPALVARLREAEIPALRGDVTDREVLRAAGIEHARVAVSTIRRREDNAPLLGLARGVPVLVRAFNYEDGDWIRSLGGRPILYAEAAADDFTRWYQEEWDGEAASPDA